MFFTDCYQMERDNIGNIVAIYDLHHRKVFEAEYDALGRQTVTTNEICFNYGYTGHEMLNEFGLIHMDGRVYDPAIGRFLSPDNYVQLPENSQSFNRYSYCINNPLKYTDPSGESFIGGVLLAFNVFSSVLGTESNSQGFFKAAFSILSPSISNGIGSLLGHSVKGLGTELLRAGAHGLASGVQNALTGENFGAGFASGAFASFAGSGAQWAGLGKGGVLGATTLFGGIGSAAFGGDFLDGAMTGLNIGLYNHTWEENGITYNDDEPGNITGQIDEVFVDGYHQPHLTLSPPTAPVEKGLELVSPEFYALTIVRALFNGALKATFSVTARDQKALFKDMPYSNKVKTQMSQGAGEMHSFPESVRAFEQNGTISYIRGNDGQLYKQLIIKGSYPNSKGVWKDGQFEFMLDKNGFINHRFFRKNH